VWVDADEAPQVGPAKILGVGDPAQHATHSIISRLGSSSAPDDSGAGRNGVSRATTLLRSVIVCSAALARRSAFRTAASRSRECGQYGDRQPLDSAFQVGPFFAEYRLRI
jgi:hypothetical protein